MSSAAVTVAGVVGESTPGDVGDKAAAGAFAVAAAVAAAARRRQSESDPVDFGEASAAVPSGAGGPRPRDTIGSASPIAAVTGDGYFDVDCNFEDDPDDAGDSRTGDSPNPGGGKLGCDGPYAGGG